MPYTQAIVDVAIGALPAAAPAVLRTDDGSGTAGAAGGDDAVPEVDEVVAVLTCDGRLGLLRAVESDLWQETLEVG